jgi:hypothetical protein
MTVWGQEALMKRITAVVLTITATALAFLGYSNIDPDHRSSWGENVGWLDWRVAGNGTSGVVIESDHLSGFIWAENIGWINLGSGGPYLNTDDTNFGVNILPGGDLEGYAWAENAGWINFGVGSEWDDIDLDPDRPRFDDVAGRFRGYAWAENLGWINLDDSVHYVGLGFEAPDDCSVLYVDFDASGANDGSSWTDAFNSLQDALSEAATGPTAIDELWVAEGTYYPDIGMGLTPGDPTLSFDLQYNLGLYGGFDATETVREDRDPAANLTILSGDLAGNDTGPPDDPTHSENSLHVITAVSVDGTAVVDGFTIESGSADGSSPDDRGAACLSTNASPQISNCVFKNHFAAGSGGAWSGTGSAPRFSNTAFETNLSTSGGAIHSATGAPIIVGCTFSGNEGQDGGAIYLESSVSTIINSIFVGNQAAGTDPDGGALFTDGSANVDVIHCNFSGNDAGRNGGAAYAQGTSILNVWGCTISANNATLNAGGTFADGSSSVSIVNTILWFNTDTFEGGVGEAAQAGSGGSASLSINYSVIQGLTGGLGGTGNVEDDPLIADPDGADDIPGTLDDDLQLSAGSSALDVGNNGAVPLDTLDLDGDGDTTLPLSADLYGNLRFLDDFATPDGPGTPPIVDMGSGELFRDCNGNDIHDDDELANCAGEPECSDCDGNNVPDECDPDCVSCGWDEDLEVCTSACTTGSPDGVPDACQCSPSLTGTIVSTWIGDVGLWDVPTNWCPEGVPENVGALFFDVLIDELNAEVTMTNAHEISDLTLGSDTILQAGENTVLFFASAAAQNAVSAGTIRVQATTVDRQFSLQDMILDQAGGGLLFASGDSAPGKLRLINSEVTGGTLETQGLGVIQLVTSTVINAQINGVVVPLDGQSGILNGTVDNIGLLTVEGDFGGPPNPVLEINGNVTNETGNGQLIANGTIETDTALTITQDSLLLGPGGIYQAAGAVNTSTINLTSVTSNEGTILLIDGMSMNVADAMVLNGSGSCTPPILGASGNASLAVHGDFEIIVRATVTYDSTVPMVLGGDFINGSTDDTTFDWDGGGIIFGDPGAPGPGPFLHTFEVAGEDRTAVDPDVTDNFVVNTMEVPADHEVTFVDDFDNDELGSNCEALYVNELTLRSGSTITIDNCKVYYGTLINEGGTIDVLGGCSEFAVFPATECPTEAACCDTDSNNVIDDVCSFCSCDPTCGVSARVVPADISGAFGACPIDTFCNIHDRNQALSCFAGTTTCPLINIDAGGAFGACLPDGFCNIHDANHALSCFAGTNACACGPMPITPVDVAGEAGLSLTSSSRSIGPGELVHVRVFVDGHIEALQSYQLHLDVSGGKSGSLELENITIDSRKDYAFEGMDSFDAINITTHQMLAGLNVESIPVENGYLATYTYRPTKDATGDFVVTARHDEVLGDQTYLVAEGNGKIVITASGSAVIAVGTKPPGILRRSR